MSPASIADIRRFETRMPSKEVMNDLLAGDSVSKLLAISKDRAVVNAQIDVLARPAVNQSALNDALARALAAAKRISTDGEHALLSEEDMSALELFILLVSRPALFVLNRRVIGRPENWPEIREDAELFPDIIQGVGRIESSMGGKIGTGFVAGDKRILTNNHVLCALFGKDLAHWIHYPESYAQEIETHNKSWEQDIQLAPFFELFGEANSDASARVRILRIRGHHETADMAVLEVDALPAGVTQLPLATREPANLEQRKIYAVGYPLQWRDTTPEPVIRRIFGADETFGTKRFSPGKIIGYRDDALLHDASTLPGSSGSCIVDFADRQVVGLHSRGRYEDANYAVPLWKYRTDPVLVNNDVIFA